MTIPLPDFEEGRHHIGLGEAATPLVKYGLVLAGAYRKVFERADQQPEAFGGRPPTPLDSVRPHPPAYVTASIEPQRPVPPAYAPPNTTRLPPQPPAFLPPTPASLEPVPPPSPPAPPPPAPPVPALGGTQPAVNDLITDEPGSINWTQDDFSGGAFQFNYRADRSMFLSSKNMAPRSYDSSLRTIPAGKMVAPRNMGGEAPILTFVSNGQLCAVFGVASCVVRVDINSGGQAIHPLPVAPGVCAAAYDPGEDVLWVGHSGNGTVGANPILWRYDCSALVGIASGSTIPYKTVSDYTGPAIAGGFFPVGIVVAPGALICAFSKVNAAQEPTQGVSVYVGTLPDDTTNVALQMTWTKAGQSHGKWKDVALFNGYVYVLTSTGDRGTTVLQIDPATASMNPVSDFPYNFRGRSLKVMGGRLYVGGSATDIGSVGRFGELHEITGNSMRQVRSFGEQYRASLPALTPDTLNALESYEGLLWMAERGGLLISYDPVKDAFFGSTDTGAPSFEVTAMIAAVENLYYWLTYPGGLNTEGFYRIATAGTAFSNHTGEVVTSEFSDYLDELKDWVKLRVMTRYGGCTADYSQDGGATWTALGAVPVVDGNDVRTTFDLSGVPDGYRIRFRLRFARADAAGFTELVAFTMAYKRPNPAPPVNVLAPGISGTAEKGQTLWVNIGDWDGLPTQWTIQWRRCDAGGASCANVGGNTMGYELTQADVGHTIRAIVYAVNSGGATPVTTAATAVVTASTQPPNPPQAEFTANVVYGKAPLVVAFTDLTNYDRATSWLWDFGDGNTSTAQHPVHVYATPNDYTVTLTATNASGTSVKVKAAYIGGRIFPPRVEFAASQVYGNAPFVVSFTDLSDGEPTAWAWTFGDGGTSTAQHPVHVYAVPGTYTVSLTATNAGGSPVKTKTAYVTVVKDKPQTEFTASVVYGSAPLVVAFTDLSDFDRPTAWLWDFGDGQTSTAQHPVHVYSATGFYDVTLTASNASGSTVKTKVAYITAVRFPPQVEFTASAVYGRTPLTIAFTDLSGFDDPTSWAWTFGDGGTSTDQHPFHTYSTPGTYAVSLAATNAGGTSAKTKTGYIHVEPALEDKHAWSIVVAAVDRPDLLDASYETYNLDLLRSELWRFADDAVDLELTDVDGVVWPVRLVSIQEQQVAVTPEIAIESPDSGESVSGREGFFALTLIERV